MRPKQRTVVCALTTVIVFSGLIHTIIKKTWVYDECYWSTQNTIKDIGLPFRFKGASQDNPDLIDYIRREMLHPPSLLQYNLAKPGIHHYSQDGQSFYAETNFFHGMRDGFFIEVGAIDGEVLSNTLYFEKELGWRGLLIEPNPYTYKMLRCRHRKAYSINAALSPSSNTSIVNISTTRGKLGSMGQIGEEGVSVPAIPLFSILLALDVEFIDFLSLDIESFEVKVLKTLPWDKVKFRLMCIEVNAIPEGLEFLIEFLKEKGYEYLGHKGIDAWFGWPGLYNVSKKS